MSRKSSSSRRLSRGEQHHCYSTAPSPPQLGSAIGTPRQGPGLMGHMAATGAGVAAGSVIGEGISRSMYGGNEENSTRQQGYQQPPVCVWELERFLTCALNQQNLSVCEAFNDAWKQCRKQNGLM